MSSAGGGGGDCCFTSMSLKEKDKLLCVVAEGIGVWLRLRLSLGVKGLKL